MVPIILELPVLLVWNTLEEYYSDNSLTSCVCVCVWVCVPHSVWVHHMWEAVISAAAHDLHGSSNSWFLWFEHLPDPGGSLDYPWNAFCIQTEIEPRKHYRQNLLTELQKDICECENKDFQNYFHSNSSPKQTSLCWVWFWFRKIVCIFCGISLFIIPLVLFSLCLLKVFLICLIWLRLQDLICMAMTIST